MEVPMMTTITARRRREDTSYGQAICGWRRTCDTYVLGPHLIDLAACMYALVRCAFLHHAISTTDIVVQYSLGIRDRTGIMICSPALMRGTVGNSGIAV